MTNKIIERTNDSDTKTSIGKSQHDRQRWQGQRDRWREIECDKWMKKNTSCSTFEQTTQYRIVIGNILNPSNAISLTSLSHTFTSTPAHMQSMGWKEKRTLKGKASLPMNVYAKRHRDTEADRHYDTGLYSHNAVDCANKKKLLAAQINELLSDNKKRKRNLTRKSRGVPVTSALVERSHTHQIPDYAYKYESCNVIIRFVAATRRQARFDMVVLFYRCQSKVHLFQKVWELIEMKYAFRYSEAHNSLCNSQKTEIIAKNCCVVAS